MGDYDDDPFAKMLISHSVEEKLRESTQCNQIPDQSQNDSGEKKIKQKET